MKDLGSSRSEYLESLKKRSKRPYATQPFQILGYEIAVALKDLKNRGLYMRLAKTHNPEQLLAIAKDISQNRNIKNKTHYFLKVAQGLKKSK